MATKKNTHGGARKKAGRKPLTDKKKELRIFVLASKIKACGGEKKAKEAAIMGVLMRAQSNSVVIDHKALRERRKY